MIAIADIQQRYSNEVALCVLACRCYMVNTTAEELRDFIANNEINWARFDEVVKTHKIHPIIVKAFTGHTDILPPEYATQLRIDAMKAATIALQRSLEVAHLHQCLAAKGIENIPYKGVMLSYQLFNDNISRFSSDMDFLINPEDFKKAKEVLEAEGYVPDYYNSAYEKYILNTSHEHVFRKRKEGNQYNFELHWSITSKMMDIPIANSNLMNDTSPCKVANNEVLTFSLQNHLLVVLIHHGVNDVWRVLRHVMDVAVFIQTHQHNINWQQVSNDVKKYRIRHTSQVGMVLVQELLGLKVPTQFKNNVNIQPVLNNLLKFPPIEKGKLETDNIRQQLSLRDSTIDRIRLIGTYLRTAITPNIRDIEAIPLPGFLYPLYYIIKPVRILLKRT